MLHLVHLVLHLVHLVLSPVNLVRHLLPSQDIGMQLNHLLVSTQLVLKTLDILLAPGRLERGKQAVEAGLLFRSKALERMHELVASLGAVGRDAFEDLDGSLDVWFLGKTLVHGERVFLKVSGKGLEVPVRRFEVKHLSHDATLRVLYFSRQFQHGPGEADELDDVAGQAEGCSAFYHSEKR